MTNETEFREELKRAIRHTDPTADQLRSAASDLETLADKWEQTEDVL
jgi:hypothetical protein